MKYDGDPADFSHQIGKQRGPNDFFSHYISEEEAKQEVIIMGDEEGLVACRPYIKKVLAIMSGTLLVNLKPGVNIRDVRDAVGDYGSVGFNRKAYLA